MPDQALLQMYGPCLFLETSLNHALATTKMIVVVIFQVEFILRRSAQEKTKKGSFSLEVDLRVQIC
jgi:hypothetical protein